MSLVRTKSPLKSKTMVGGLLGILGSVACFLELAGKLPIGAAGPIIGLVGGALSIFGRAKAVSKLKW